MGSTCLIVEGGGFKTGFTTGLLDAFISCGYDPFDSYIAVSGGTVALSYFLSGQYRTCITAIKVLAKDKEFVKYRRTFGKEGFMDIDFLAEVANKKAPFHLDGAIKNSKKKTVHFVATDVKTGAATYLVPKKKNWIDAVVASSTLPFVTKGKHKVEGRSYFDGGWSDSLPVKWAYKQGASKIILLRTHPLGKRFKQNWPDYFGSIYHNPSSKLGEVFKNNAKRYNASLDFIENPPSDLKIHQVAPKNVLKSTTYSYTNKTLMSDYRYGLDQGLLFVNSNR